MKLPSLWLLCLLFAGAGVPPDLPIAVERVSPRVAVASYASNNVTAVTTERGVILIDSNRSPSIMRAILTALKSELGRDDWTWLVNTHGHWDHTWGNQVVVGVALIGHKRCAEYIDGHDARRRLTVLRHEWDLARLRSELAGTPDDAPEASRLRARVEAEALVVDDLHGDFVPTPPCETFDDRTRIDGGDVTTELFFCGAAHTDHDVFVFVPEEALLLTGDVFCSGRSLCFGVDSLTGGDRLLGVIDDVLARAPEQLTVIPGHGDVLHRDDLVRLRGILADKWSDVDVAASAARRIADGKSIDGVEGIYFDEAEFHTLGRRYIGRGRLDLARDVLEAGVERMPESALLHDLLGETLFHMGDEAGAREHYRRSLELAPHNRNAADVLEMLAGTPSPR